MIIEPRIFGDSRGVFYESFNQRVFDQVVGASSIFVQDNHSRSVRGVLRGLHYQIGPPQGKLVRVVAGCIYDVVVDLRSASPTYRCWLGVELSAANARQLWVPPGLAHGFLVLSDSAECLYKATAYYAPEHERCLAWDDRTLAIEWPLGARAPLLSAKDALGEKLDQAETFE
jgi:dTDP-4-dehydrorhamnose 3,5-epimerase